MKIMEIRPAEGGMDAKLFAKELANSYIKMSGNFGWLIELYDSSKDGLIKLKLDGNIDKLYNEVGGHRIQRIPPTEKRGRVHTSTVTVSIIESQEIDFQLNEDDIVTEWFNGTVGAGGQNHQKTQNCARVKHIPSGLIKIGQSRSRKNSLQIAMDSLKNDLILYHKNLEHSKLNETRKNQIGSGQRGDKIRTYRFQDDKVVDHNSGKQAKASKIMNGKFNLLWN